MPSQTDWAAKREAFLYTLRQALGQTEEPAQPGNHAAQADWWAAGVDPLIWERWGMTAPASIERMCLRHPLSGQPVEAPFQGRTWEDLRSGGPLRTLEEAAKELVDEVAGNDDQAEQRRFLALWRLLSERVRDVERRTDDGRIKLGDAWPLVPADGRTPDHTMWQRASAASAFASALSRPCLLVFTIASVQEFVDASRRTQDYWQGSFLISYLMWTAMRTIAEAVGPDAILLPNLQRQPLVDRWLHEQGVPGVPDPRESGDNRLLKIATLPNIFTAVVPAERAGELAEEAAQAVRGARDTVYRDVAEYVVEALRRSGDRVSRWIGDIRDSEERHLSNQAKAWLSGAVDNLAHSNGANSTWEAIWERQREDFLEPNLFWAVVPWPEEASLHETIDLYRQYLPPDSASAEVTKSLLANIEGLAKGDHTGSTPGASYPLVSTLAGRLLTARKGLRHFSQVEEPGWKCSQCGVREALHPAWPSNAQGGPASGLAKHAHLQAFWDLLRKVDPDTRGNRWKLVGRIRRHDRLCATCLVRRLAWEAHFLQVYPSLVRREEHIPFPSSSSIATAAYKAMVLKTAQQHRSVAEALGVYVGAMKQLLDTRGILYWSRMPPKLEQESSQIQALSGDLVRDFLRIDGEWLHEDTFDVDSVAREYGLSLESEEARTALEQDLKQASGALMRLRDALRDSSVDASETAAPSYYATLYLDADRMGRWVSGRPVGEGKGLTYRRSMGPGSPLGTSEKDSLLEAAKPLTPAHHTALAQVLGGFALHGARQVIEENHYGIVLYCGGDDLRAMLPIKELPRVLQELDQMFRGLAGAGAGPTGDGTVLDPEVGLRLAAGAPHEEGGSWQGMTASVGVCLSHYTHPLQLVVQETKDTEKHQAKDELGRNAWAVSVLKRSGSPVKVGAPWAFLEPNKPSLDLLERLQEGFRGQLSSRLGRQMAAVRRGIAGMNVKAQQTEWRRLLERRREETGRAPAWDALANLGSERLENFSIWRDSHRISELDAWSWLTELVMLAEFLEREE